jgi:predicted transposase/invertase (TIGR01784 family)
LLNTAGDSVHSPVTDDVRIARAYAKLRVDRQSQEILLEQVESMITEAEKNEHRLEARAEGLAEGEIKKAREMAKSMLAKEFNISVIAEISGLSEEEILKL